MPANTQQGVYFSQGTPELSIDTTPYAAGTLGQEVTLNVGSAAAPNWRTYKYVKAGATVTARSVVQWTSVALIGSSVIVGAVSGPTNNALFAGVSAADSSATVGQYFWIVLAKTGSTAQIAHNVATNATQSDTGLYWVLSADSLGTRSTSISSNYVFARLIAMNISSMNSTSATSLTTTATSGYFIFL